MRTLLLTLCMLVLTHCVVPVVVIGTGAVVIGLMCREKGISGTLTDADLSARVRSNFSKSDYENNDHLSSKVNISVSNSEILLTGMVDNLSQKMLAEQTVWEVFGVKQVINQLQTRDDDDISSSYNDWLLTLRVKSTLLADKKINLRSFNYAIRTMNGVVYVMGIAKNEFERERALNIVSRIPNVIKVVSLVRLKHEVL